MKKLQNTSLVYHLIAENPDGMDHFISEEQGNSVLEKGAIQSFGISRQVIFQLN